MAPLAPARLILPLGALALLAGCGSTVDPCGFTPVVESLRDRSILAVNECTGQVTVGDADDPGAWLRPVEGAIAWADDDLQHTMIQGRYRFEGTFGEWQTATDGGEFVGVGAWQGTVGGEVALLRWDEPGPEGALKLRLEVSGDPDRVSLAFACNEGERFYGLGARPDRVDQTGTTRMHYVAEQGIGQRDYPLDEIDPIEGRTGDAYFPVPWTVTDRGLGLGIGGTPVARTYLCGADEPGVVRFEAWDSILELLIFADGDPRSAVARWTLGAGTPAPAPDWAYGPWMASQRGTDTLLELAERVRALGIPATALWVQDWIGAVDSVFGYDLDYHWEWDPETYPELPAAIEALHDQGFAFLGYFNPFVTQGFPEWDEGVANGYLPLDPDGGPYTFGIVTRTGSVVDLENPEAVEWARSYFEEAPAMGQDGWMCDFAEWMPFDARLAGGITGQEAHNRYPLQWQDLNMEVLNEALGVGNGLCFNRSGWTGSWARTPVTWGGDQETDWSREDGLPTARNIGVNLGLSGVGRYGSDIAGYSSLGAPPSTRELYWRWTEMGAFEPVMRVHDGIRDQANWRWDEDDETIAHFRRYARWHLRMLPLWRLLDATYRSEGVPFLRHGILVEDRDSPAYALVRDAPDQHFLGDDLLVAPVVTEGATSRDVVLPPGRWYGLLDQGVWDAPPEGATVTVDAPLGEIPVFARGGSLLPLVSSGVQTTYRTDGPVDDDGDLDHRRDLLVFPGADAAVTLVDGRSWTWTEDGASLDGAVTRDGVELPDCAPRRDVDCVRSRDGALVIEVTWGGELAGSGWSLVADAPGTVGTVTIREP